MIGLPLVRVAELASLGMTVPTIILAMAVVVKWAPAARVALRSKTRSGDQWFILGVAAGFVGAALDNLYWSMPWTASYLEHSSQQVLFSSGVYANIFFRQLLGIFAATCHLRAAEISDSQGVKFVNSLLVMSYLSGFLFAALLLVLRGS